MRDFAFQKEEKKEKKTIVTRKDDGRFEAWPPGNKMAAVPFFSNLRKKRKKRKKRLAIPPRKPPRFVHCVDIQPPSPPLFSSSLFFFLSSYLTIKYDVIRLRVAGIIKREGHAGRQLNSHELCVHEGLRDFCRAFPRRRVFPCNFPDRPSPSLSQ